MWNDNAVFNMATSQIVWCNSHIVIKFGYNRWHTAGSKTDQSVLKLGYIW